MGHKGALKPSEVKARNMRQASLNSKSATPARNRGASGSTTGGAGTAKRPPKGKM